MKRAFVIAAVPVVLALSACSLIPRPGAWHPIGGVPGVTNVVSLTSLSDGRVLVIGDAGTTVIFDPRSGRWSDGAPLPPTHEIFGTTAIRLKDGSVFAVAGSNAFVYRPDTDRWSVTAAPHLGRAFGATVLLADGRVLLAGGTTAQGITPTCEIYDPQTRAWSAAASLDLPRTEATATLVGGGRVLLTGGYQTQNEQPGQARPLNPELYDPQRDRWTAYPFAVMVGNPVVVGLPDGQALATAGNDGRMPSHATQVFDPRSGTWTVKAGNPGGSEPAVIFGDGRIALLGGRGFAYDPAQDRWDPLTLSDFQVTAAAALPDGRALVLSSSFFAPSSTTTAKSAIFDPSGYPPLPGSTGPLASTRLIEILAAVAGVLLILTTARSLWVRWRP